MDEIQSSPSSQPREQGRYSEDLGSVGARRPSTLRRLAQNAETFGLNRDHHVHLTGPDDVVVPDAQHLDRVEDVAETDSMHQEGQESEIPHAQWEPSIALGTCLCVEGEDLNAIQMADRKVIQTRFWADYYKGVPEFVRMYQEALRQREELDETAEANTKPRSATIGVKAIQKRLNHLRVILETSEFPPERANIEVAIAGYETGEIPYSDSYTIIWAGQIVDSCPDFASFTTDRAERLDHYADEYGPGWMWYEPPLSGGGGTVRGRTNILAKKGVCLENEARWRRGTENMGHYRLKMGFRRRKGIVARGRNPHLVRGSSPRSSRHHHHHHHPQSPSSPTPTTPTTPKARRTIPQPTTSKPGTTGPDPDGPRVFWDVLLDTGATLPCLFDGDLTKLGISRRTYAAQSSRTVETADSVIETRVYELDVSVQGAPGGATGGSGLAADDPLPSPTDPVSPLSPRSPASAKQQQPPRPACTIPVVTFPGDADDSIEGSASVPSRLSGIIPMHLCYSSSAPGAFRLWLGDDRRDVLGAGRLPADMGYGEILGGGGPAAPRTVPTARRSRGGGVVSAATNTTTTTTLAAKRAAPPSRASQGQDQNQQADVSTTTPDRVVFEHHFRDGSGRVLRDEEGPQGRRVTISRRLPQSTADAAPCQLYAAATDSLEDVKRPRIERKRRGSETLAVPTKKTKVDETHCRRKTAN